jgi:hypothetical protein
MVGLPRLYLDCPQLDILVHENLAYIQRFMAAMFLLNFIYLRVYRIASLVWHILLQPLGERNQFEYQP